MKISLSWLRRYVPIEEDAATLAHDLTMFGVNVEGIESLAPPFRGVVFGRVLEVNRHPGADRLTVCAVDAGGARPLNIVCGAPNVRAGMRVPVALEGAILAGGLKIRKSKIRGQISEGMICSKAELGIGDDQSGIMELDFDETPGATLEGRLGETEHVFEIEVTPNRPDLLCHVGIAREVAALYRRRLAFPEVSGLVPGQGFDLKIERGADCPRYTAAFLEEVVVGPSPQWMQKLLRAVGQSAINNIVDATNFVLLELGHPLHAFDRDALRGDEILVRRARRSEAIVTLDGVRRELDPQVLVIADEERPVAIAGIMGGRETEIGPGTKRILIESAVFDPRVVRRARQQLKLETEASYRFEREADIGIPMRAAARVCRLVEEMGAAKASPLCSEWIDERAALEERKIRLRVGQANRVMGTQVAADDIAALLERLSLSTRISSELVEVSVPTFRRDLKEEIDLVEEAARVYGYDHIGLDEERRCSVFAEVSAGDARNERIVDYLVARGFAEVITSSFMDPEDPLRMGWTAGDERSRPMAIANPLTLGQSMLRTSLLPGLLGLVKRNAPAEHEEIRLFELGKVFIPGAEGSGLPHEEMHLSAVLARYAMPLQWIDKQRELDYFDMKGELEAFIERLGLGADVSMAKPQGGGQQAFTWHANGELLAECGVLDRKVSEAFEIETPIFYFEFHLDVLPAVGSRWQRFNRVSPFPAVKRDLCIVVRDSVLFSEIRNVVMQQAQYIDNIRVFDFYRGGHLGEGKRSYTFRLSFRSPEGTLDGGAVDREIEAILLALRRELQAEIRTE